VVFLSDGGDSVRNLQAYLHPDSEHWLDWFHITMRITVLQQQVKTLKCEQPEVGEEVARELESTKHFLWHGNTFQALQRLEGLLIDLEFPEVPTPLTQKVAKGIGEFETYIRNNEEFIPNFGERYRNGETISTAFVESTVNQVISKRMVKKQQMQWTPAGRIYSCRPEQRCLTMNSRRYSADGIRGSAQRPDPRPLGGLVIRVKQGMSAACRRV